MKLSEVRKHFAGERCRFSAEFNGNFLQVVCKYSDQADQPYWQPIEQWGTVTLTQFRTLQTRIHTISGTSNGVIESMSFEGEKVYNIPLEVFD